jgi:hypothetical protein
MKIWRHGHLQALTEMKLDHVADGQILSLLDPEKNGPRQGRDTDLPIRWDHPGLSLSTRDLAQWVKVGL